MAAGAGISGAVRVTRGTYSGTMSGGAVGAVTVAYMVQQFGLGRRVTLIIPSIGLTVAAGLSISGLPANLRPTDQVGGIVMQQLSTGTNTTCHGCYMTTAGVFNYYGTKTIGDTLMAVVMSWLLET